LRSTRSNCRNGNDDVIFGGLGRDILIGGAGNDMIDGDEADDLLFGDNVFLFRRGGDDGNLVDDITSKRFQTLAGTLLYSRSDLAPSPNADSSGQLLTDGIARNYRDPDGAPWWAEYTIEYGSLHNFSMDEGTTGVGSFGNDYLAGGQANDQIFGQLGNDIVQGDGGIDLAFAGTSHVGASRTSGGVSDPLGPLTVSSSYEASTDGEDYVEGGGGNDVIFGGLGQDDLVGGSSSFFSLDLASERPDGDDYIFGGAGSQIDRDSDATDDLPTDGTASADKHSRDADTIAGDNANIIRIGGTNGGDVNPNGNLAIPQYLTFNYDNYGPLKIIVRGVTLLDYTAGGPDFRPELFALVNPGANPAFRDEFGIWAQADIGGHDEIHGETGDDTVYTGGGQDRIFGDADDDDLIGGWGNDWISGGTGQDGVIGDDGRIFTSRNTAGDISQFSEPLYGIKYLLANDPDPQHPQIIHGNVIDEFIYTPGQVQTATINPNQALNKAVDITPYNLHPNSMGGDDPLYDPIFADDMIFGGLGADFLHGASGDDAIGGGEALSESYTQLFDEDGNVVGLVRTDFSRPWNPGDILHFGADTDPWNAPKPAQSRLGEFFLYDEYDPRRVILFNAAGQVWKSGAQYAYQYFLNLTSNEGPTENGPIAYAPNGTPTVLAERNTDGDDVIFGDLGNDWQVGGTGRDTIYSGWGNDLANADDVLLVNNLGVTDGLNDTPDTHPLYADRVYGGAGLDILIGNTGADRLIDWVGEFNSYIVPFSAFGIDTVSRQVNPQLPEFLYALSASQGADPTRDIDTGNSSVRNGEPDGELGLIVQQDHGLWQDQTGGPTDPQPGNIPGGRRDVKGNADFNDGSMSAFAVDSGVWQVSNGALSVAAESLGKDAAAVFYADAYLPIYYELKADVTIQKPTAGWKANAYVMFDYFSPTDFKFAGIDAATNKMVVGHRTAEGWIIDAQAPYTGQIVSDTRYQVLVAVNGTLVTVQVENSQAFSFNYAPRILNGEAVGLNKGFIGVGSDNARGLFDNVVVQTLPPQMTLDVIEDFNDGAAEQFVGDQTGTWAANSGRYASTASAGSMSLDTLNLGAPISSTSYVEIQAIFSTTGIGGIVFDEYSPNDFKFVALDVASQKVLIGHVDPRRGWVVDTSVTQALVSGTDYSVGLVMNGASLSVTLNGLLVKSYGFNSSIADGAVGVLSRGAAASSTTSFNSFRFMTNDPIFERRQSRSVTVPRPKAVWEATESQRSSLRFRMQSRAT
jgi:Ca2+-binding RTX toxin-like protein